MTHGYHLTRDGVRELVARHYRLTLPHLDASGAIAGIVRDTDVALVNTYLNSPIDQPIYANGRLIDGLSILSMYTAAQIRDYLAAKGQGPAKAQVVLESTIPTGTVLLNDGTIVQKNAEPIGAATGSHSAPASVAEPTDPATKGSLPAVVLVVALVLGVVLVGALVVGLFRGGRRGSR